MGHGHSHAHHDHGHHGHPAPRGVSVRGALGVALVLNGLYLVVEVVVGLWSGSLALLSDAAHMLSDVGALALALGTASLALRSASPDRSYGWRRAEVLGAFVNGLTLVLACAWIFAEAVERLYTGGQVALPLPALLAGAAGLGVNLGSAWVLTRAREQSLNVRAAMTHMLADALGSVAAMVAAALAWAGVAWADPAISLVVGGLVLRATWGLLRDSTAVLLQFAPAGVRAQEVEAVLRSADGVEGVHELHLWSLDGQRAVLSAHVVSAPGVPADSVLRAAERRLGERFGELHTTLQVEPAHAACPTQGCSLG